MTSLRYIALDSDLTEIWRHGGPDANGQAPERHVSDGGGNTCRHCLDDIAGGDPMLVLAHRPFPGPQPYAEIGPIFVHAEDCPRYDEAAGVPGHYAQRQAVLIRGYGRDDRILYGTGKVVPPTEIETTAAALLSDPKVAYLHLRSSTNNCFQFRIERG